MILDAQTITDAAKLYFDRPVDGLDEALLHHARYAVEKWPTAHPREVAIWVYQRVWKMAYATPDRPHEMVQR